MSDIEASSEINDEGHLVGVVKKATPEELEATAAANAVAEAGEAKAQAGAAEAKRREVADLYAAAYQATGPERARLYAEAFARSQS